MNTYQTSTVQVPVTTVHTTTADPAHPPSAIKGNITSMVGKMTHNPTKEHDGNIMVANSREQKAARFETKAIEWDRKGNAAKATKNREKALLYRNKAVTKMNQPLTATPKPVGVKNDKAARCEVKALEYERKGNVAKAQQQREKVTSPSNPIPYSPFSLVLLLIFYLQAYRIRTKHNIAHPVGTIPPTTYAVPATNYTTPAYTTAPMH